MPVILDGGMGHMLRRLGVTISGEVGSTERFLGVALANVDQPDLVREAHLAYLRAGATVLTSNNYAVTPAVLQRAGRYKDSDLEDLTKAAVRLARECATPFGAKVAGCMPPLGPSYRPDLVPENAFLHHQYRRIAKALRDGGADVLLCETMSSSREAKAAFAAAMEFGLPVWVAYTLQDDGRLRSGETVEHALSELDGTPDAVLCNCCHYGAIEAALATVAETVTCPTGGYANAFCSAGGAQIDEYDTGLDPERYVSVCRRWVGHGATLLGGCCGVFPEHIAALSTAKESLEPAGYGPVTLTGKAERFHAYAPPKSPARSALQVAS
jgi:S-methylmethionine-dependent homocysteine/selenocysteine methylase